METEISTPQHDRDEIYISFGKVAFLLRVKLRSGRRAEGSPGLRRLHARGDLHAKGVSGVFSGQVAIFRSELRKLLKRVKLPLNSQKH